MFTDTEQEEIRLFADRITPANWIFPKTVEEGRKVMEDISKGAKSVIGNVYLDLFFHDEEYDGENRLFGEASSPMRCENGAVFGNLAVFYHTEEMIIDNFTSSMKRTIIHELAHNAVERYLLWKTKSSITMRVGFDTHGPEFQRALWMMLRRAIKYDTELADEVIEEIDFELDRYAALYDDSLL